MTSFLWFLVWGFALWGALCWADTIWNDADLGEQPAGFVSLLLACPFLWAAIIVFWFN